MSRVGGVIYVHMLSSEADLQEQAQTTPALSTSTSFSSQPTLAHSDEGGYFQFQSSKRGIWGLQEYDNAVHIKRKAVPVQEIVSRTLQKADLSLAEDDGKELIFFQQAASQAAMAPSLWHDNQDENATEKYRSAWRSQPDVSAPRPSSGSIGRPSAQPKMSRILARDSSETLQEICGVVISPSGFS